MDISYRRRKQIRIATLHGYIKDVHRFPLRWIGADPLAAAFAVAVEFPTKGERGVKGYAACSYSTGDR